ncbi:MAG: hypothetical protein IPP96_02940 [Chitinophagaceae bacterium]|nr:hypothetical protein [Chitinophagaceae bacterium]
MKKTKIFLVQNTISRQLTYCMLLLLPVGVFAQTDTTKNAGPVAQAPELISPSLSFACVQKGDNTIDLLAALKTKIKGTSIKLPQLKVKFIRVDGDTQKELGYAITNGEGKISFTVKDSLIPDKEGKLHFKASFAGNKSMDPAEEELTVKRAKVEIVPVKEDSLLKVNIKLIDIGTGKEVAIAGAEVGIFVKRSFLPMKIGTATTDSSGEATVEVPNNLPGDAKGNITLLAKLDENEAYGNLESSVIQQWGVPVSDVIKEQPRALWSPHPPIWMLVTFIVLMGVVWGHFLVIVFQLWRLRKEEPHPSVP